MSLLFDLAALESEARQDLLDALCGRQEDRAKLDDLVLSRQLVRRVESVLGARPGHTSEALRARLVEVAAALNVESFPRFEPPGIDTWDLISDRQLLHSIGTALLNEAAAITEGVTDSWLTDSVGQRVLAKPTAEQLPFIERVALAGRPKGRTKLKPCERTWARRVLEGDPAAVQLDDMADGVRRSTVVGVAVCDPLPSSVWLGLPETSWEQPIFRLAPLAGELLAAWLLNAPGQTAGPHATPMKGLPRSSAKGRTRVARDAKLIAALVICACFHDLRPEEPLGGIRVIPAPDPALLESPQFEEILKAAGSRDAPLRSTR